MYKCQDHLDETVQETFCFISKDLTHDSHGVQHFAIQTINELKARGLSFKKIVHFSDGAPAQYKNKTCFADASFGTLDVGITTEKHFFGSRHGKGPCDREIGVVKTKRMAHLAVLRTCVIVCAKDLHDFGTNCLTRPANESHHAHNRRSFLFVWNGDIDRVRPERIHLKAIRGTHYLHSVRGISPLLVKYRGHVSAPPCVMELA